MSDFDEAPDRQVVNGATLRAIRERSGLSVRELVELLNAEHGIEVHEDSIRNIETGARNASPRVAAALAAALKVPIVALLSASRPEKAADRESKLMDGGDRAALAAAVLNRRRAIGWTQQQVADHGGISADRMRQFEIASGGRLRLSTLSKLDDAMCWAPGSALAVLEGGAPTESEVPDEPRKPQPTGYGIEVVTTGTTVTLRLVRPSWSVAETGELHVQDGDEQVSTFAAGFWLSVRRLEGTDEQGE